MNKNHLNKVDIPLIISFGSLQPDDLDEFHFMSIGLFLVQRIIKTLLKPVPKVTWLVALTTNATYTFLPMVTHFSHFNHW